MKTTLSVQVLWAIAFHAQFISAGIMCPMPGPPGSSCASYPPPDRLDCYKKYCHDVYKSSSTSTTTKTSSAVESDDGLATSIIYATTLITITSCGPEVTNCPAGKGSAVITSSVIAYTTVCPISNPPVAPIKTAVNQGAIATSAPNGPTESSGATSDSGKIASTAVDTNGDTSESTGPEIFTGGAVGNRLAGWGLVVALAVVGGLLC
ncbi:hypothetical protein ACMFMG_002366 [Clarireedia jacksonii]